LDEPKLTLTARFMAYFSLSLNNLIGYG
jgi:hypothetical protein